MLGEYGKFKLVASRHKGGGPGILGSITEKRRHREGWTWQRDPFTGGAGRSGNARNGPITRGELILTRKIWGTGLSRGQRWCNGLTEGVETPHSVQDRGESLTHTSPLRAGRRLFTGGAGPIVMQGKDRLVGGGGTGPPERGEKKLVR